MDCKLTEKQVQVLKYIACGKESKTISKLLKNSIGRIQNIRSEIVLRMGTKNMYESIYIATLNGWI